MNHLFVWLICAGTIGCLLFRPKEWPEAVWSCAGAFLLVAFGFLPLSQAGRAVAKGNDVYLFLTGMMLLSELARQEGVFDWLATLAVKAAKGSPTRLFLLVYLVGTLVTIFLSNDATAVVLTPAVCAAVRKAKVKALPYVLICAFIANAASFALPISNPANLVVYGKNLPALLPWLRTFLLPSIFSIVATFVMLRWAVGSQLRGKTGSSGEDMRLTKEGRYTGWGITFTALVLMVASGFGIDLGLPTFVSATVAVLVITRGRLNSLSAIIRDVSWSVLPLVAGLFVLIEALDGAGALRDTSAALEWCGHLPTTAAGALAASFGVAALSNVMNNLPSGLLAAGALQTVSVSAAVRNAILIGIDLGPNLSVTGSLATVLWLIVLRREGESISSWQFLKLGMFIMPPALLLSTIAVCIFAK